MSILCGSNAEFLNVINSKCFKTGAAADGEGYRQTGCYICCFGVIGYFGFSHLAS